MSEGALAGLRVIDLTRVLAGPLCGMWLGDMGADVIKIERPGRGDDTRSWGPPWVGTESAYYLGANRNKRSVTLDLTSAAGRDVVRDLIRSADIVVDNFKLGTLDRWGLGEDWFEAEAPQAVRCTIGGYGSSGPKAGLPGYDFILQAETGLMAITGEPAGGSMKLGVAIVDICTGMLATMSILAALQARHNTGRGQRTEVSLHDTGIQLLANVAANHLVSGAEAGRYGNGHPNIVPYTTYVTSDGELAVSVGNDGQFVKFADALGHPEWARDERFARNQDRVANRDILDRLIGEVMTSRSRSEWIAALTPHGIPSGPINAVSEALGSPQSVEREMVVPIGHPSGDDVRLVGIPFRFFGTPASIRRHPPLLGEHTDEVLGEVLGMTDADIRQLAADGITATRAEEPV